MNRSGSRLKPLAPKPEACRPNHFYPVSGPIATNHDGKNMNAFAGSHLGVPAGPLETVTSMDPKDYVWGVPQAQPGLFAGTGFASQPLFAAPQGFFQPQSFGLAGLAQTTTGLASTPHLSSGGGPLQQVQSRPQGCNAETPGPLVSRPLETTAAAAQPSHSLPAVPEQLQAESSLEQVDDLLNMAFDDDCIKKLLSEPHAGTAPVDCNIFGSPQERCELQERLRSGSPCPERTSPGPSHNSASTAGCTAAPSPEMLDATDLHFPMEETSVLETMSGFGDLDLHLLEGGLTEVETTSAMAPSDCTTAAHSLIPASGSSSRALKRAKSESGTASDQGSGHYNPLLSLEIPDALASINGFLANHTSFPQEKRQAAVEAIAALNLIVGDVPVLAPAQVDPSADAVAALTRASSYPRRKRAPPA